MTTKKDQILEQIMNIQVENAELHERISALKAQQKLANEESSAEIVQSETLIAEITSTKDQLKAEEAEISALKKELVALISTQQEIQTKIEDENNFVYHTLVPNLKKEEEATAQFYADVLKKCEKCRDTDMNKLRNLVEKVQEKRKAVATKAEEHQKILRLITFNKNQTTIHNSKTPSSSSSTTMTTTADKNSSTSKPIAAKATGSTATPNASSSDSNAQPQDSKPKDAEQEASGKKLSKGPASSSQQPSVFDNPLPCFMLTPPQVTRGAERRRTLARLKK